MDPTTETIRRANLRIAAGPERWHDPKILSDSETEPLEAQLNKAIVCVLELLWKVKHTREIKREEERKGWEAQKRRDLEAKYVQEEKERRAGLETKAANWRKAQQIRDYVAAVEQSGAGTNETFQRWKD